MGKIREILKMFLALKFKKKKIVQIFYDFDKKTKKKAKLRKRLKMSIELQLKKKKLFKYSMILTKKN